MPFKFMREDNQDTPVEEIEKRISERHLSTATITQPIHELNIKQLQNKWILSNESYSSNCARAHILRNSSGVLVLYSILDKKEIRGIYDKCCLNRMTASAYCFVASTSITTNNVQTYDDHKREMKLSYVGNPVIV
ncbi:unnamed protein product [Didymodactylos carnosus]|uniref:Uncharacterized protein n=1 Tax=Didymodactylos carnosus TaxID=1234261 RepID=A0A8S2GRM6_9BILA|nr:unnamed protein product [Didymodactylos carnosus]CAF3549163.1 unnamed protein product [Didymodactylos carnosus]